MNDDNNDYEDDEEDEEEGEKHESRELEIRSRLSGKRWSPRERDRPI